MNENDPLLDKASSILENNPLVDGHNDMPWRYVHDVNDDLEKVDFLKDTSDLSPAMATDIPRLQKGKMGAQFWAIYIPEKWDNKLQESLRRIEFVRNLTERYKNYLEFAESSDDICRIHSSGKIASLIGLEGSHCLEGRIEMAAEFYRLGVRYITMACNESNEAADAAFGSHLNRGLSDFGRDLVKEMNRLGIMVDLSHTSDETMKDALETSRAPLIFSHSNCRAICKSPRNVPDDIIEEVTQKGGIVMVTFVPMFVTEERRLFAETWFAEKKRLEEKYPDEPENIENGMKSWRKTHKMPLANLSDLLDHIDHLKQVAGIDHIGVGSDLGGFRYPLTGMEDVSRFPYLFGGLLKRGYSEEDVAKIAGRNILSVMKTVKRIADSQAH